MLLPGANYSESLMFSLEGFKNTWVDGRAATLYGEAISALNDASELSKSDIEKLEAIKGHDETLDLIVDIYNASKKGFRFAKAAAPLILADGPLPFGDVVFAAALGLDFAIAAYQVWDDLD